MEPYRLERIKERIRMGDDDIRGMLSDLCVADQRIKNLTDALKWISSYAASGGRHGDALAPVRDKAAAALDEDQHS